MLDRGKLMKELRQHADKLFIADSYNYERARQVWQEIACDGAFIHKIKGADVPWALPTWEGQLDGTHTIQGNMVPFYQAASIDGSQVYPDRHQGSGCFLINIGVVSIKYGVTSSVQVASTPHLFTSEDAQDIGGAEFVNCKRQEMELQAGLHWYKSSEQSQNIRLLLFDGSLIFWHLKEQAIKNHFMPLYLALLHQLYQQRAVHGYYISLPKNRELTNLLRASVCNFAADDINAVAEFDHVTDTAIAHFFLEPWTYTAVFRSNHDVCKEYPPHLWPHFVYMHIEDEIARIEFPAWIAQDEVALAQLLDGIADQCRKGRGYPVVLAEAHEQAVIKGPDRDFFYQLITKMGVEQRQRVMLSQKSMKKRGIHV